MRTETCIGVLLCCPARTETCCRSLHALDECGAGGETRQHTCLCPGHEHFPLPTGIALEPVLRAEHLAGCLCLDEGVLHRVLDACRGQRENFTCVLQGFGGRTSCAHGLRLLVDRSDERGNGKEDVVTDVGLAGPEFVVEVETGPSLFDRLNPSIQSGDVF